MASLFLVHGGLWDSMDAEHFWRTPGIVAGLESHGLTVLAPDRPRFPSGWDQEVIELGALLPSEPVTVVGASNGCTVAALLALAYPHVVERLVLAWPATGGDTLVDIRTQTGLLERGASENVLKGLLRAETLRGVKDSELAGLGIPVAVLPSVPENPSHQRKTVDALLTLIPGGRELPGCPEPPTPAFPPHRDELVATLASFVN
jgi:pimeloyl-ACP methyl ester carboxylesterase